MDYYDILLILGAIVSAFFVFAPHSVHLAVTHWGVPHAVHQAFGISVGLVTLYFANKRYQFFAK